MIKIGSTVLYKMTENDYEIAGGNRNTGDNGWYPATVVAIWENEYPNNPKCTLGLNLKVHTDAMNDLWVTSAEAETENPSCPHALWKEL